MKPKWLAEIEADINDDISSGSFTCWTPLDGEQIRRLLAHVDELREALEEYVERSQQQCFRCDFEDECDCTCVENAEEQEKAYKRLVTLVNRTEPPSIVFPDSIPMADTTKLVWDVPQEPPTIKED